jgi:hypothetical protein
MSRDNGCSHECRAHLLGSLMFQIYDKKLQTSGTEKLPYPGQSYLKVLETAKAIKDPQKDWHQPRTSYSYDCQFSLTKLLHDRISQTATEVGGLR